MIMNKFFDGLILIVLMIVSLGSVANGSVSNFDTHNPYETPTTSITNIQGMMAKYTAYNLWANQEMADWLRDIPEELFDQEIESSFSSLRKTLIHIWNAEYGWLRSVRNEPWGDSPGKDFSGTGKELLDGLLRASSAFKEHVTGMSDEQLSAIKKDARSGRETVYADMVHHCMNHSTYHRGQLITMGRQLGLKEPPRTDFIYYISL